MEYPARIARSFRFEARELHNLCPLFCVFRNEFAELGGRAQKRRSAQGCQSGLEHRLGERRVDLPIELVDNIAWGAPRRADTTPVTCLEARHEIAHPRDLWQGLRARLGLHC